MQGSQVRSAASVVFWMRLLIEVPSTVTYVLTLNLNSFTHFTNNQRLEVLGYFHIVLHLAAYWASITQLLRIILQTALLQTYH